MSPRTGVTVVVCTYKRDQSMGRLLDSLCAQEPRSDGLVIVDASPNELTETLLSSRRDLGRAAESVLYLRVGGRSRGLTRQRDLGLRQVDTDLVIFCDDDVEARPGCLAELARTLRAHEDLAAAVPFVENECSPPPFRWRLLRRLGAVPDLRPGRYYASGISVPWRFQPATEELVEGDWLFGSMMAWRTGAVRATGFSKDFEGYGNGEDLDLTLRGRAFGRLVLVGSARIVHHHEAAGRPDPLELGFMTMRNSWLIHRRCLPHRRLRHVLWFCYATMLLAAMRSIDVLRPSRSRAARGFLRGQLRYLFGGTPASEQSRSEL